MNKIEVILNGSKVTCEQGITILELAKENGINIPTLCKDPRLAPITSCFLCAVEVKGARSLVPSCATKVSDGMEIFTDSDTVISSRRTALELILSNHSGDCIAPCKLTCPAGCDIQGYVGLIANGKYDEAIKLIKETIPLPAAIGRVCPKFCEDRCRRQNVDEPVAIDHLKRFIADYDLSKENPYKPETAPKIGKKAAIIGGGPAGLSAAYYLVQYGVDVEIFEAKDSLGGMIYYGVPDYRLPKEITNKEVKTIIDLGVTVHSNKALGRDFTLDDIKDKYDVIVLACGAWKSRNMRIPDETAPGVYESLDYLVNLNEGKKIDIHGKVAVIGGGNTAFDCARTALRIGADEVSIIYRRTRDEMPANEIEKIEAEEEGIIFKFLTNPVKVVTEDNRMTGIELIKMELGEPDASGRRRPVPIEGSNYVENYDYVISSIGLVPDYSVLGEYSGKLLKDSKWIVYNKETGQTEIDNIFTAGDFASGAATVVEALAGGKKAADSIMKFLKGASLEKPKEFISTREDISEFPEGFFDRWEKQKREEPVILSPEKRRKSFEEIESVFTEEKAVKEAKRCMECGCMDVYQCDLKKYAEEYNADEHKYAGSFNSFLSDDSHPYFFREPDKCILCGRCVSLCKEKINIGVYGYIQRGFSTIVGPSFNKGVLETECISCGACISACPVGAIVPKTMTAKKIPLKGKKRDSYCFHCSIGCKNTFEVLENSIYEVHENPDYLCVRGKFDFPDKIPVFNEDNFEKLNIKDALVYPSPSLSCEDYEALKSAGEKQGWKIVNYYSQSTLWQYFARKKQLPSMDFFNEILSNKALVLICSNIEINNPIAINQLNNIRREDTKIILINDDFTKRLKNMGADFFNTPEQIININLENYDEIVLLIDPVDFDKTFGPDSSLDLYSKLVSGNVKLRTTLFSVHRNLYSFYDADKIIDENSGNKIFINTIPDNKEKSIFFDFYNNDNGIQAAYSFQTHGTYLNSKNIYYHNIPVLDNNFPGFMSIFKDLFGMIDDIVINKVSNIENESGFTDFNIKFSHLINFPDDIKNKYLNKKLNVNN